MTEVLTYEALKADRDAQQKRADALAVESVRLKKAVTEFNELYGQGMSVANWHLNGDLEPLDNFFDENDWNPETPATSAALAAIEARGVDKLAAYLWKRGNEIVSEGGKKSEVIQVRVAAKMAEMFAAELRGAK